MTATNHILTGALIGGLVKQPYLALPLALVSHYVLDVLPHFGVSEDEKLIFRKVLIADTFLAFVILLWLAFTGLPQPVLLVACGIVAASPDLLWLPYFIAELRGKMKPFGWYSRIAKKIQWAERPWGMVIEVAWGLGMIVLIADL